MKQKFFLPSLFTAMLMAGCGGGKAEANSMQTNDTTMGKKTLVVYFSHAGENYNVGNIKVGNTRKVADKIAELTGADMFEIVAEKNYDMPYNKLIEVAAEEERQEELPAFKGEVKDINKYDTIFIGGPVWWGTYPRVMFTFFKRYDLNGKVLIPFNTNEGSGMANCEDDVREAYPKATVMKGLAIRGKDAQEGKADRQIERWVKALSR